MFEVKSSFELKDADPKSGIVTGYCAIFGNIDSDSDVIMPGAFSKTIQERGPGSAKPRIKHLWQHNSWQPIGIPTVLKEDDKGLYFETKFGSDSFSQDALLQHIDGLITELSIGFNTIKSEDVLDSSGGFQHRKLTELKLWEYSSVTWGANSLTEIISAKAEDAEIYSNLNKRLDALTNALKNGKYTEESHEQFEAEIEKIKTIIKSLKIVEPVTPTHPVVEPIKSENVLSEILKSLKNG